MGEIPDANASFSRLSISAAGDENGSAADDSTDKKIDETDAQDGKGQPSEGECKGKDAETVAQAPAEEKPAEAPTNAPKHAKPEGEGEDEPGQSPVDTSKTPKHAKADDDTGAPRAAKKQKPSLNVVRDTANAFSPTDKPGPVSESKGNDGKGAAEVGAATQAGADASSDGGASDAA